MVAPWKLNVEWKTNSIFSSFRTQSVANPPSFDKQGDQVIQQIEVPLTFDAEFFEIIQGDVTILDTLQTEEQKAMMEDISALGKEIAKVTNPTKYSRSDLDRWRELFDLYLQAGIFFSTNELDHGSRNGTIALKQLQWFQAEVMRRGLVKSFKLPASREALNMFMSINLTLLRNIKFQEINQLAISKILKSRLFILVTGRPAYFCPEFDKHTSLGARSAFPPLIQSDKVMSETMAKAVCSEVSMEIVKVVPQLDDYLCPVCFSISYKPVRLNCGHVFCIRCMIRMQKAHDKHCPLCRNDAIMDADSGKESYIPDLISIILCLT
jgi:E3 ubiquitin-protein ligase BAH